MMNRGISLTLSILILSAVSLISHAQEQQNREEKAVKEMTLAAQHFLSSLSDEQRGKATYPMHDEERLNFHFVPKERNGIPFSQLTPAQDLLAQALLNTAMSSQGAMKTNSIMFLDQVLHELENQSPRRDPENYYVTVFGEPKESQTWGWRLEGHHISLNFTVYQGHITATTPLFFGANPAMVQNGPMQGMRVLAVEEDLGRELVKSLNTDQKEAAIISDEAPADILTEAKKRVDPLEPKGLPASKMNEEQRRVLQRIIREYVYRIRPEFSRQDLQKIRDAGEENITFAWAGGTEPGDKHYYRVQGPTFVFEYDNTQNNANHIHTVWRDFEGDFGYDVLAEHYKNSKHHE